MTRWARSSTSKASNKKHPEEATGWEKMSANLGLNTPKAVNPTHPDAGPLQTKAIEEWIDRPDPERTTDSANRTKFFFEGSWVTAETKKALEKLREQSEETNDRAEKGRIEAAIRHIRRAEEKKARRLKQRQCFRCRSMDHQLADCPETELTASGSNSDIPSNLVRGAASSMCYRCGGADHTSRDCTAKLPKNQGNSKYPFATCFICKEVGHISSECKQNDRGIYPQGGCCRLCGSKFHLRKDCPGLKKMGAFSRSDEAPAKKAKFEAKKVAQKPKKVVAF